MLCNVVCILFFFFVFSSRRRHTRCLSDWSSDVCSSDLIKRMWFDKALVYDVTGGTGTLWTPNTVKAIGDQIVDKANNIQQVVTIIGDAKTAGGQPDWNGHDGGLTPDGNVVWANQGKTDILPRWGPNQQMAIGEQIVDPRGNIQQISALVPLSNDETGGSQPSWNATIGGTTPDHNVTWTNQGPSPTQGTGAKRISFIFVPGDENQKPSPVIQNMPGMGIANTPAYRGQILLIFDNLDVTLWGRVPSIEVELLYSGANGGDLHPFDPPAADLHFSGSGEVLIDPDGQYCYTVQGGGSYGDYNDPPSGWGYMQKWDKFACKLVWEKLAWVEVDNCSMIMPDEGHIILCKPTRMTKYDKRTGLEVDHYDVNPLFSFYSYGFGGLVWGQMCFTQVIFAGKAWDFAVMVGCLAIADCNVQFQSLNWDTYVSVFGVPVRVIPPPIMVEGLSGGSGFGGGGNYVLSAVADKFGDVWILYFEGAHGRTSGGTPYLCRITLVEDIAAGIISQFFSLFFGIVTGQTLPGSGPVPKLRKKLYPIDLTTYPIGDLDNNPFGCIYDQIGRASCR